MPSTCWDHCNLDSAILEQVEKINEFYSSHLNNGNNSDYNDETESAEQDGTSPRATAKINSLQSALQESEAVCRNSLDTIDSIILVLNGVGEAYGEVTGRTNNLMMNCERLLEQQVQC